MSYRIPLESSFCPDFVYDGIDHNVYLLHGIHVRAVPGLDMWTCCCRRLEKPNNFDWRSIHAPYLIGYPLASQTLSLVPRVLEYCYLFAVLSGTPCNSTPFQNADSDSLGGFSVSLVFTTHYNISRCLTRLSSRSLRRCVPRLLGHCCLGKSSRRGRHSLDVSVFLLF